MRPNSLQRPKSAPMTRHARGSRLLLEPLEDRVVPTNNPVGVIGDGNVIVTLTPSAGVLRITGYNDNVVLTIQQSSPGVLQVAGVGMLVNGFSDPAEFALSSISEIDVVLLNGNDTVTMNNFSVSGTVSVFTGSGSDTISLGPIAANLISVSAAGPGPDIVRLDNAVAGAVQITAGDNATLALNAVNSAGTVTLTAGKNASVSVNGLAAAGDLDITLDDKTQSVIVNNSSSSNVNILQSGTKGNPSFDLENDTTHNLTFNAGDGNNTIALSNVNVATELLMRLGAGTNTLSADHVTALFSIIDGGPSQNNTFVDGGGNSGLYVFDFIGH